LSCLYVATAMHQGFGVLKLGISSYDDPGPRLWQHEHSKDNPFRERIREFKLHVSFGFQHLMEARNCETAICGRTKRFDRVHVRGSMPAMRLYVPVDGRPTCTPSGEWLLFPPQHEENAITVLLAHAIEGLRDLSRLYRECGLAVDVFAEVRNARLKGPAT
jgi:predicted GIY-YIG superfamily endonuclease